MKITILTALTLISASHAASAQEAWGEFDDTRRVDASALEAVRGQNAPLWQAEQLEEILQEGLRDSAEGLLAPVEGGTLRGIGFSQRSIADNQLDGGLAATAATAGGFTPSDTGNTSGLIGGGGVNSNSIRDSMIDVFLSLPGGPIGGRGRD